LPSEKSLSNHLISLDKVSAEFKWNKVAPKKLGLSSIRKELQAFQLKHKQFSQNAQINQQILKRREHFFDETNQKGEIHTLEIGLEKDLPS
jgi:hypothetical protein